MLKYMSIVSYKQPLYSITVEVSSATSYPLPRNIKLIKIHNARSQQQNIEIP